MAVLKSGAAANGELIVLMDYGKPLAVITSIEDGGASQADGSSDASKFRQAWLFRITLMLISSVISDQDGKCL